MIRSAAQSLRDREASFLTNFHF